MADAQAAQDKADTDQGLLSDLKQPQSARGDDFDLVGVGDFALEVKRIAGFVPNLLMPWWAQAVLQTPHNMLPAQADQRGAIRQVKSLHRG